VLRGRVSPWSGGLEHTMVVPEVSRANSRACIRSVMAGEAGRRAKGVQPRPSRRAGHRQCAGGTSRVRTGGE
jgi:hypothetical protein